MHIKIGEVIKQLRIEHSITQEKLANYLNVSPQSISKWENGLSYPDITLIPSIALFFNVSTDDLFLLPTYTQKFTDFQSRYQTLQNKGAIKEQIALCREMFLEFPRNYIVMSHLASSLIACYEGLEENHQTALDNNYLTEAIKLYELILSDCNDISLQLHATKMLCKYYPLINQTDKALTLVNKLSSLSSCKDLLLEDILTGKQCIKQQQSNILQFTDLLAQSLIHLSFTKGKCIPHLSNKEKINFVHASNALYKLILSDENYFYFHSKLVWNYRRLAELYLAENDPEQSLSHLNLAFHHAKCYDQLPTTAQYTAPFISQCTFDRNNISNSYEGNECKMLYYRLTTQGTFDTLKEHPAFKALLEELSHWIN